jgi:hypothetical protein
MLIFFVAVYADQTPALDHNPGLRRQHHVADAARAFRVQGFAM